MSTQGKNEAYFLYFFIAHVCKAPSDLPAG